MKRLYVLLLLPALALGVYDTGSVTLNAWRCGFTNYGPFGSGAEWPVGSGDTYIYGAGFWLGAVLEGDTLVSVGYNPNSGKSEFDPTLCRYWREGYGDSLDRIYQYPGDWPPPLSRFPLAPQQPLSEMDVWSCFGDSDPALHDTTGHGRPLGVDVALTAYAFTGPLAEDIFILKYDITNSGGSTLSDAIFGLVMDPDVGNAADDMTGLVLDKWQQVGPDSIHVRNVGFAYSTDHTPDGAVAAALLRAPDNVGLTAFKRFTLDIDPLADPDQYLTMAGYDYPFRTYAPYDSVDMVAADKRFILCTGPFDVPAESTLTFWYATIGAPYWNPVQDTTGLALRYRAAESLLTVLTGVEEQPLAPARPAVRVYPSIVNARSPLHVVAPVPTVVRIFDSRGGLVMTLTGRDMTWDGTGPDGHLLPAGVYLVNTGGRNMTKVILLRD